MVLVTAPLLSRWPPRATKASTKVNERITVFVILGKVGSVILLSFLLDLGSIIEEYIHVEDSGLLLSNIFVDLIFAIVLEVVNGRWVKKKSTSQDGDHVIEADTSTGSLLSFFVLILQFQLLVLGKDAPFLVEKFIEISTTAFSHLLLSLILLFELIILILLNLFR